MTKVNHIGMTVPDIFAAVDFYQRVFGLELDIGPQYLRRGPAGELPPGFDARFHEAKCASLHGPDGVGIELFEFVEPQTDPRSEFPVPYTRRGPYHLCLTVSDVEGVTQTVVQSGGRIVTEPKALFPGKPYVLSYVTDPWGTVLELMSHTYAEVFSSANWPVDAFPLAPRPPV